MVERMLVSSIADESEAYCRETGDVVDLKRDPAPALTPRHGKRHRSSVEPSKVAANAARATFADVLIAVRRTRLSAGSQITSRIRFRIRYQIPAESTLESTVQELLVTPFSTPESAPAFRSMPNLLAQRPELEATGHDKDCADNGREDPHRAHKEFMMMIRRKMFGSQEQEDAWIWADSRGR